MGEAAIKLSYILVQLMTYDGLDILLGGRRSKMSPVFALKEFTERKMRQTHS